MKERISIHGRLLHSILSIWKHHVLESSLLLFLLFAGTTIFLVPSFSFKIGNIFFGGIQPLYNIQLAQLFYKTSLHSPLSDLPPRYAHYQLGRTYFIQGKLSEAAEETETELKIYPDNTTAYYILGLTYGYLNRPYEAIDVFSKYIDTHPGTWAGRNDKAWLQFRVGDIKGALDTIEPIAKDFSYTPWVQNTYCTLLLNTTRYKEAKNVCARAKAIIDKMTPEEWGRAYPGNDPRIYSEGLAAMKNSISQNLSIVEARIKNK